MSLLFLFTACSSAPPSLATEPDPSSSHMLAEALCKLVQGARHKCTLAGNRASIEGGRSLVVDAFLDHEEETLGQLTFDGRARITVEGGPSATTRFQHYGWGREEALEKGVHYWAVLHGSAIVDWVLADASRPALVALERGQPRLAHQVSVGGFRALRGWTFLQGVKVELAHDEILAAMQDAVSPLAATEPHSVDVRITSEMGEQIFSCHVDGAEAPQLCALAQQGPWPAGIGWELRQSYLLVPEGAFPDPPPPEPEEPEEPEE